MKYLEKYKKWLVILLLGFAMAFTACTDLEEELFTEIRADEFAGAEAFIISDAVNTYNTLAAEWTWGIWATEELTADAYAWTQKGRHGYDNGDWQALHWHTYNTEHWNITRAWERNYKVINFCNDFLVKYKDTQKEDLLNADIDELRAIVRGLRSYHYFLLVNNFRRVPLVTDENKDVAQPSPVDPEVVIKFIEDEMMAILPHLPGKSTPTGYGFFNKAAAYMLLAKCYLNSEVWTGVARWNDCLEALNNIPGEYKLAAKWQEPFLVENKDNPEHIFVIPFEEGKVEGFRLHYAVLHYSHASVVGIVGSTWNGIVTQPDHFRSFDENDLRLNQFLVGPQYDRDGVTPILGTEEAAGEPLVLSIDVTSMAGSREDEGARNLKYPVRQGEANMNNDWAIWRASDAELMKAECYLRLGQAEQALPHVNPIRERAFGDSNHNYTEATLTLDELLAERGRELSFEGHRRQDLVRFGKFGDAWWDKEETSGDEIFPYPLSVTSTNPNIKN